MARAAIHNAGEQTLWGSAYRVELARIYLYQGRNLDALSLLKQAIPDGVPLSTRVHWHTIHSLASHKTGDTASAERELFEVEENWPQMPEGLQGDIASAHGILDLDQGKLAEAEQMFRSAVRSARASGDQYAEAQALLNLGVVALQQEHDEDAVQELLQARAIAEKIGARLQLEKILGTAGSALYDFGDFVAAEQNFQDAEKQAESLGAPTDEVRLLTSEGLTAFRQGDRERALRAYETSLQQAKSIGMQEGISDAHANLAQLLLDTDPKAAEVHIREAARTSALRRHRPDQKYAELLEGMLWSRTGRFPDAVDRLAELERDKSLLPSLHWQTQQELARVNLRMGQERTAELWFRRAIETFHHQQLSLEDVESALPFLENGTDLYSDYVQFLVDRGRTDEALTVVDQSRAETLMSGAPGEGARRAPAVAGEAGRPGLATGVGEAARRRLARSLGGAILVYYVLPRESYLWVTTPERSAFFRVAGGAEIRTLVEAHRRAILDARDLLSEAQPTGRALFQKLLGPAVPMLQPGERVFLVGDGVLNELNFETLVCPHGGAPHFWIEDVVLTHVPSLRLLRPAKAISQRPDASGRMLLMGDPEYRSQEYQALPKAAEEIQDVMQHFRPESRTVLTGVDATPAAYRQKRPGEFRYIHFVAHSTANTLKPLDSAVILSRGGDGTDKLYAREIVADRLRAELVTISGCYSSGTRVYAGEGAVGLAWAFERAGAQNVIGALWEVNDASTPALMDRLYGGLLHGAAPDVALRDAKLELLHSSGVFRKPLYWAPFQLYSSSEGLPR